MTEEQRIEHNRLFKKAMELMQNEIPLHERPYIRMPGWWLSRKLNRALQLFYRVLQLNPKNWSALWMIGKVHQRFRDHEKALSAFDRACQIDSSNANVPREAAQSALELGKHDAAIAYTKRAIQIDPADHGLKANLALAYLFATRIPEAQEAVEAALAANRNDPVTQAVWEIVRHFALNNRRPPATLIELTSYWQEHCNNTSEMTP